MGVLRAHGQCWGSLLRVALALAVAIRTAAISYQGELRLAHTDGGLFGTVTDGSEAWFGVDGYPAKVVRIRLGLSGVVGSAQLASVANGDEVGNLEQMQEVSRLEFLPEEERLWSLTAEPLSQRTATSWFAYAGVGNPAGRLVKIDLLQMKRVGYVSLSDKDIRGGMVLGSYAYFVTSAKPASVLRCPTLDMFHGDTFHPVEVSLALGEHSVQAVVADEVQEHLLLGTYTQPGRVVKLSVPDMTRSASLLLPREDQMLYCGALWGQHAVFGTSTLPGRLVKVHVRSLTHVESVEFKKGEDRAVSVVVWGGQAFVGLANEWEQDTSSIIQVDLESMREVAALVTPPGCTWLYAASMAKDWAFFGSRYHGTSVVTRIGLPASRPDVPEVPVGNATGQDAIRLSWKRPFPRYHTGGAPIVGARVLVRPAWHWDWTSEHVYGAAAPDPYAPKTGLGRIARVHEDPADLLDDGYGAVVDGLDPMEEYKFAVILTNAAGPSHRSRSSEEIMTSFSATLEVGLLGLGILLDVILIVLWLRAVGHAQKHSTGDAAGGYIGNGYVGIGSQSGLLGEAGEMFDGRGGGGAGGEEVAAVALLRQLFERDWWLAGEGVSEPHMIALVAVTGLGIAVPGQMWFHHYLAHPRSMSDAQCLVVSGVLLMSLAALTWAMMGVAWAMHKGAPPRVRAWTVAGTWALWAAITSSLAMLMAWSGSFPSPQGRQIALSVTIQLLFVFFVGACGETAVSLILQKKEEKAGCTPRAASLPDWVTAL